MTLILSASDFLYVNAGVVLTAPDAATGSARLHADIDSAAKGYNSGSLPSSSYCREYSQDSAPVPSRPIFTSVSGSVEGGAYTGSFGNNAISARAWVRKNDPGPGFAIFLKNDSQIGSSATNFKGYGVAYPSNQTHLQIIARQGPSGQENKGPEFEVATDEWHRIRLDYIPIGSMKDVLNFYTASAGGTNTETWELVDTMTILSTDNWYVTSSTPGINIGYMMGSGLTLTRLAWVDDFDVYVTPVG